MVLLIPTFGVENEGSSFDHVKLDIFVRYLIQVDMYETGALELKGSLNHGKS